MFFPKNAKILLIYQRFTDKTVHLCCRPPRGGRGLKLLTNLGEVVTASRPPRGGRGLKSLGSHSRCNAREGSPPSRGAWIEMLISELKRRFTIVAPLAGGVD